MKIRKKVAVILAVLLCVFGVSCREPHAVHDWVIDEFRAPTCTEDGFESGHCSNPNCTETYTKVLPATGHSMEYSVFEYYSYTVIQGVCSVCGETTGMYYWSPEYTWHICHPQTGAVSGQLMFTADGKILHYVLTPTLELGRYTAAVGALNGKDYSWAAEDPLKITIDGTQYDITLTGIDTIILSSGDTSVNLEATVVPIHEHEYETYWANEKVADGSGNYHSCKYCDEVVSDYHICTAEDTDLQADIGGHYRVCDTCNSKIGYTAHTWESTGTAINPSYTEAGIYAIHCSVCDHDQIIGKEPRFPLYGRWIDPDTGKVYFWHWMDKASNPLTEHEYTAKEEYDDELYKLRITVYVFEEKDEDILAAADALGVRALRKTSPIIDYNVTYDYDTLGNITNSLLRFHSNNYIVTTLASDRIQLSTASGSDVINMRFEDVLDYRWATVATNGGTFCYFKEMAGNKVIKINKIHTLSDWESDATYHWKTVTSTDCDCTGEIVLKAKHTFVLSDITAPTAFADGSATKVCSECGYENPEPAVLAAIRPDGVFYCNGAKYEFDNINGLVKIYSSPFAADPAQTLNLSYDAVAEKVTFGEDILDIVYTDFNADYTQIQAFEIGTQQFSVTL